MILLLFLRQQRQQRSPGRRVIPRERRQQRRQRLRRCRQAKDLVQQFLHEVLPRGRGKVSYQPQGVLELDLVPSLRRGRRDEEARAHRGDHHRETDKGGEGEGE